MYIDGLTVLYISLGILAASLITAAWFLFGHILPKIKGSGKVLKKDAVRFCAACALSICCVAWIWVN